MGEEKELREGKVTAQLPCQGWCSNVKHITWLQQQLSGKNGQKGHKHFSMPSITLSWTTVFSQLAQPSSGTLGSHLQVTMALQEAVPPCRTESQEAQQCQLTFFLS